jgi:hypothetical protein
MGKEQEVDFFSGLNFEEFTDTKDSTVLTPENLKSEDDNKEVPNNDDDTKNDGELSIDLDELLLNKDNNAGKNKPEDDDNKGIDGKVKTPSSSKKSDSSSSSFPYTLVFKQLKEKGVLNEFDEVQFNKLIEDNPDDPAEAILDTFGKNAEKAYKDVYDKVEQDAKWYLEMKNADVPQETAAAIASALGRYTSITDEMLEDEDAVDLRKDVLRQSLKISTKFSEEEIEELIDDKVEKGKDVVDAKKSIKTINQFLLDRKKFEEDNAKQQQLNQKQQVDNYYKKLSEVADKTDEIIPGVKINKQTKEKLISYVKDPYKEVDGRMMNFVNAKRAEDPEKFDLFIAYALHTGILDGKWEKPMQAAKTDAKNELNTVLKSTTNSGGFRPDRTIRKETEEEAQDDFDTILNGLQKNKRKK